MSPCQLTLSADTLSDCQLTADMSALNFPELSVGVSRLNPNPKNTYYSNFERVVTYYSDSQNLLSSNNDAPLLQLDLPVQYVAFGAV
jgi:hypothetical protein